NTTENKTKKSKRNIAGHLSGRQRYEGKKRPHHVELCYSVTTLLPKLHNFPPFPPARRELYLFNPR
uniref:Uncharacterized protein n=1 Tax=Anopheles atroparvus TaxID=41427 RepID=A0AAG5DNY6_ANOAO